MKFTALNFYSEGLVASHREGSHYIEVFALGVSGGKTGEVSASVGKIKEEGIDGSGNRYQVVLEFSDTIPARWLPGDTNRITPPDVRIGERVQLYRVADSDQFFWKTLGLDNNLRRLETVIFAFSASEEDFEELNVENSYFVEISTHGKHITLNTSKANGEPFGYTIQLNTGEGNFTVTDDVGNYFILNSKDTLLHLQNKDGSLLKLDKRNGLMVLPDTFEMQCKDYILKASNSITTTTKTHKETSDSHDIKTQTHDLNADSSITGKTQKTTLTSPTVNVIGNSKLDGTLGVSGAVSFKNSMSTTGKATLGSADVKGKIKSLGKDISGIHTHSAGGSGPPN